jgi:hypothetical protein
MTPLEQEHGMFGRINKTGETGLPWQAEVTILRYPAL